MPNPSPTRRLVAGLAAAACVTATLAASPADAKPPLTLRDVRGATRPALSAASAAVVIIDAQKEYLNGKLPLEGMPQALAEIRQVRMWAAEHNVPVIHVMQQGPPDGPVFAQGSLGAEVIPDVAPAPGEAIIPKTNPNAFHKTGLHELLHQLGRRQIVLTGFMTHMCLDSTARAAFDLNYQVFVVASATAERAIPGPDGKVIGAADLRRATLTALNDRFAWIVASAAALPAGGD